MYPDIRFMRYKGHRLADQFDDSWQEEFIKNVATRGVQIIKARGASSAASAANAALDHMRDWILAVRANVAPWQYLQTAAMEFLKD